MWREILERFHRELLCSGKVDQILRDFHRLDIGCDQLRYAESLMEEYSRFFKWQPSSDGLNKKDDRKSLEFRVLGNSLHKQGKFVEALSCYNKSICFAASEDHLAIGYSNRSAVLYEMGRFNDSLENIRLARDFKNLPAHLKDRLDKREEQCIEPAAVENKDTPIKKIELSYKAHPKIPFLVDRLEIRREGHKSWIYAKEYMEPEMVIAKMKPFVACLLPLEQKIHCHFCLRACANLIPCPNCTSVMFCDENCLSQATDEFHKWECPLMDLLCIFGTWTWPVFALQMVLKMVYTFGSIKPLIKYWQESSPDWFTIDKSKYSDLDHFTAFYSLPIYISEHRSDVLPGLLNTAIAVTFLKREIFKHSDLKGVFETEEHRVFFGELLFNTILIGSSTVGSKIAGKNALNFGVKFAKAFQIIKEIKLSRDPNVILGWCDQELVYVTCRSIKRGEPLQIYMPESDKDVISSENFEKLLLLKLIAGQMDF